jgi:hypothetical protein
MSKHIAGWMLDESNLAVLVSFAAVHDSRSGKGISEDVVYLTCVKGSFYCRLPFIRFVFVRIQVAKILPVSASLEYLESMLGKGRILTLHV